MGLLRPPILGGPLRFFCAAIVALAAFFLAFSLLRFFWGRFEVSRSWGHFLVDLRAVVLVFTILARSLKYNESLGTIHFPDWVAISRDRSFPFNFLRPLQKSSMGAGVLGGTELGTVLN